MMRIAPSFTAVALAFAGASAPVYAAEVTIAANGPVVELQVSQEILGDPDQATISAGVTTRAQTAVAAMERNAVEMDRVLRRMERLGIPEERIQTSGISLNPQYNHRQNQPPEFIGYQATNTVSVDLRDLERIGPVLDALVAAGATNLNGPNWRIENDEPLREQAREAAFEAAQEQARDYARMAGYSGARLLSIEEQMSFQQPKFERSSSNIVVTGSRIATPTRPGQVGTSVTLTVKYELTR
ncbi:MAG: SIMPL domain-containing protein [Erythrobacter sp.]|nr:SIMPL domain-containing protein [Erythrobacter sp.]